MAVWTPSHNVTVIKIIVASLSTLLGNLLFKNLDGLWRHLKRMHSVAVAGQQAALVQKLVKNN
jgi:hypothetical protein